MRRGLFFVLMVVLVLRGLLGTAMAAGMVSAPTIPGTVQSATALPLDGMLHHSDAHDMALPTALDHSAAHAHTGCSDVMDASDAHQSHSAACSACDICHSAMLALPVALVPFAHSAVALQASAAAQFASALAARLNKPPIA